jgi:hypothetical protein
MGNAAAQVDDWHVHDPGQLQSPSAHRFQRAIREIAGRLMIRVNTMSGYQVLLPMAGSWMTSMRGISPDLQAFRLRPVA